MWEKHKTACTVNLWIWDSYPHQCWAKIWFDLIWFDLNHQNLPCWFDLIWFGQLQKRGWFDLIWFVWTKCKTIWTIWDDLQTLNIGDDAKLLCTNMYNHRSEIIVTYMMIIYAWCLNYSMYDCMIKLWDCLAWYIS